MLSLLLMSLLIGVRHALESDHLAAVASLATRSPSLRQTVRLGATWGLGHTLTLFLFGSVVLWMDTVMPERLAHWLEFAVGLMLVGLGIDVLRRLWKERVHYHVHRHNDGTVHFHAHSHGGQRAHDRDAHRHEHPQGFPLRALLVGLVHGMAGSAALILLTLQTLHDPWLGMLYMLVFGIGSILGMAAVSVVIAWPLKATGRRLTWAHNGLQATIGLFTLGSGLWIALESAPV
ncbi:MAG TPA: urease accessory protein [Chromatiaceae bacterium]|nr:urease accessory protein [Chromatiaceae bacterium]